MWEKRTMLTYEDFGSNLKILFGKKVNRKTATLTDFKAALETFE